MKIVLAIVANEDGPALISTLNKGNFQVTKLASTGGFLKSGNTTLLIGVEDDKVAQVLEIIGKESCQRTEIIPSTATYDIGRYAAFPIEVQVGGATIFVLDVDRYVEI